MSAEPADVWVYLQHDRAGLTSESKEAIAAGRQVAEKLGQRVVGVLIGDGVEGVAREAVEYGADRVLYVDGPAYEEYLNLRYADAIYEMAVARRPYAFLFVANELGKDVAGRVAYRLGTGLATDNVQLAVEDYFNPQLNLTFRNLMIQIRPDFGTRLARIYTPRARPQMATIRPGNFTQLERKPGRKGALERFLPTPKDCPATVKGMVELPRPAVDLRGADVVITLGLGILRDRSGKSRNPREAYDLAVGLKGAVERRYKLKVELGATRALIYAGLRELEGLIGKENQVGQTGATVSPDVYFAIGVSGSLQHKVGMSKSGKIVAINTDPEAPIFQVAHYPVVGDLYEELPRLIELIGAGASAA
ncbi:MAG: electron transfer flavoprotein subunit alpha/FixB family protein [Nitrososphaerota archaeon]|nr:electron transfer flavoprotein subunit alpha/FixB family protein [Nitrososphaerota archaeon]